MEIICMMYVYFVCGATQTPMYSHPFVITNNPITIAGKFCVAPGQLLCVSTYCNEFGQHFCIEVTKVLNVASILY